MKSTYQKIFIILFLTIFGSLVWASPSLKSLLDESGLPYIKRDTGWYYVPLSIEGETISFYFQETVLSDNAEADTKIVYFYSIIDRRSEQAPPALYKKIGELNEKLKVGKIGISEDGMSIYYISSFWLEEANPKTLGKELAVAFKTTLDLKDILNKY